MTSCDLCMSSVRPVQFVMQIHQQVWETLPARVKVSFTKKSQFSCWALLHNWMNSAGLMSVTIHIYISLFLFYSCYEVNVCTIAMTEILFPIDWTLVQSTVLVLSFWCSLYSCAVSELWLLPLVSVEFVCSRKSSHLNPEPLKKSPTLFIV